MQYCLHLICYVDEDDFNVHIQPQYPKEFMHAVCMSVCVLCVGLSGVCAFHHS